MKFDIKFYVVTIVEINKKNDTCNLTTDIYQGKMEAIGKTNRKLVEMAERMHVDIKQLYFDEPMGKKRTLLENEESYVVVQIVRG